ncbi:MAG: PorV/PorQ family protein [Balneolales bacterium]
MTLTKRLRKSAFLSLWSSLMILMAMMLMNSPVAAQDTAPKVGQAGMAWLNMPQGARAAGMGNAFTSVADDASSFFWNPAGYAFTTGGTVFANHTQWIADINTSSAAVSYDLGQAGVVGLNAIAVDWGTLHGTTRSDVAEQGFDETGTFSPVSSSIGASYAYRVSGEFGLGVNVKYLYEKLGTTLTGEFDNPNEVTAKLNLLAIDFGTIYYLGFRDLRMAVSLRNFSTEEEYRVETFPLPMTFRFGMAMNLVELFARESNQSFTLSTDFIHSRDYSERLNIGAEYGFGDLFFLRGGYKFNYDNESFSAGAGVKAEVAGIHLRADYAFLQMEYFNAVNMLTIDFGF